MIKGFYKKQDAETFLKSKGVSEDLLYMNMNLVNGRWIVQF